MSQRKILVTSALIYANGAPHLGHLVGTIQADIWVRLQKMLGHSCTYICGSDSHGTPIMIQAQKMGLTPEALIQETHQQQMRDFGDFHIAFDNYHATHSAENQELVMLIYQRLQEKNNIVKRMIKQMFDPIKQMFLPDRYVKGECPQCHAKDQYGDNCEVCGKTYLPIDLINPISTLSGAKPEEKESEHYFFKLNDYHSFLKEWTRNGHLQSGVTNKLNEWFQDGLREWDISRDAPYFGFLIPGEKDKYFYVWLDAPIGYMAIFKNLCDQGKQLSFSDYWENDKETELYHFIGKDIIYFHALFWPAILQGANFRTPTAIFVNGFLTIDGQKMSKSRGTFIKARTYLDHLPAEALRYYFAAKLSSKIEDLDLNFDDFLLRINADLVGKLINIASRSANFINNYFNHQLSATCAAPHLLTHFATSGESIAKQLAQLDYSHAIRQIMALADQANQYIDEQKPWKLIKDAAQKNTVQEVCTVSLNLFRILIIYLKPILPETALQVEKFLNIPALTWEDKETILLNHTINIYTPLMNRIDPKQIEALKMAAQNELTPSSTPTQNATNNEASAQKNYINIDDFSKIDLRIAKILKAEHVAGADKLLQLQVDLGEETRQIFAGIKSAYQPEQLIGKYVVVVANLAPRTMRFGVSEGMVLAAGPGGSEIWLVSPDEGATAGMKVK